MAASAFQVVALLLVCVVVVVYAGPTNKEDWGRTGFESTIAPAEVPECTSGHRREDVDGCGGSCFCLGGRWVCPEADCRKGNFLLKLRSDSEPMPLRRNKRVPLDGERCAPGITYMDECNTCICSQDGIKAHASCTFKICPK